MISDKFFKITNVRKTTNDQKYAATFNAGPHLCTTTPPGLTEKCRAGKPEKPVEKFDLSTTKSLKLVYENRMNSWQGTGSATRLISQQNQLA
ncbi:hypothetical protein D770_22970 [Flammeovirgaceae bacterium 311]|nr:hypothetical protein D770_22970 [Flammeovirgaceae bacterium 311]